jgi:cytidine deaminase
MSTLKIEININRCKIDELNSDDRELINRAIDATNNSYANYSHFYVGAAVRLANRMIIIGANQENAAFPSGLCGERTAVFAAQANYPKEPIQTLAIAAKNSEGLLKQPITPCGACRQVLIELEHRYKKDMRIILYGTEYIYIIKSVKDLLPLSFTDDNML